MTQIPEDKIEAVLKIAAQLSVDKEQETPVITASELIDAAAAAQIPAECVEVALAQVIPNATEPPAATARDRPMMHPAEGKAGSHSTHSQYPATITFVNRANGIRKLYWLDYAGHRKFYRQLTPNQRHQQPTYLTHPWLVTNEHDQGLAVYYPDAGERLVELR
ncbi:MAG: hypothetical protein AAF728_20125 [Cyanobacteria bacterium P01_D01_bin.128]